MATTATTTHVGRAATMMEVEDVGDEEEMEMAEEMGMAMAVHLVAVTTVCPLLSRSKPLARRATDRSR